MYIPVLEGSVPTSFCLLPNSLIKFASASALLMLWHTCHSENTVRRRRGAGLPHGRSRCPQSVHRMPISSSSGALWQIFTYILSSFEGELSFNLIPRKILFFLSKDIFKRNCSSLRLSTYISFRVRRPEVLL